MVGSDRVIHGTWRSVHGDLTDEEWVLIGDLFEFPATRRYVGRPAKWSKREIVNAILYVAATGCQWRALPAHYPHWSTVHRYHITWSHNGTWEAAVDRLREMARQREGRDPEPSGSIVDARSVRGAATVTSSTRGYDAGKKISGRKTFGIVDTNGLMLGLGVFPASVSDNFGGIAVFDTVLSKIDRIKTLWCDSGFKNKFVDHCRNHHVTVETVNRIHPHEFKVLPRRWIVERTWSWIMNHRRLQIDYERDPKVTEGFVWAAHCRLLLRRLTRP
jgi:transposase